jgi:hypothetical protein
MNTGTGVLSIVLALGALIVSAANSKTAEARPSYSSLHAFKAPTANDVAPAAAVDRRALGGQPERGHIEAQGAVTVSVSAPAERITPPHLLENRGLRRLHKAETSPAMLQVAAQIVKRHYAKPVGTEITVDIEGKQVIARIERHFHPEGGPVKPWGFHPGVSLFIAR